MDLMCLRILDSLVRGVNTNGCSGFASSTDLEIMKMGVKFNFVNLAYLLIVEEEKVKTDDNKY